MEYSQIELTRKVDRTPFGDVTHDEYKIIGDSPYVFVPSLQEPKDRIITIGHYKLKVIEELYYVGGYKCVRVDYPFYRFIVLLGIIKRFFSKIEIRIIMTLAVWGLADYHPAQYLSWKDVKIIKYFLRLKQ